MQITFILRNTSSGMQGSKFRYGYIALFVLNPTRNTAKGYVFSFLLSEIPCPTTICMEQLAVDGGIALALLGMQGMIHHPNFDILSQVHDTAPC
jgi:hypothetical protein